MNTQEENNITKLDLAIKHIESKNSQRPAAIEALNALYHQRDNKGERMKVSGRAKGIIEVAFNMAHFEYSKMITD
ncbi:hypothetical protein [Photobacterium leiognathi]|uniref:hypothetical protein n=1 Tax=Photobacterium leiognathi TaxID=553611 RepID=UPI0029813A30|nr:hypothetical protein [Photobacterium leiognathi]